jgi:hypothetical protein
MQLMRIGPRRSVGAGSVGGRNGDSGPNPEGGAGHGTPGGHGLRSFRGSIGTKCMTRPVQSVRIGGAGPGQARGTPGAGPRHARGRPAARPGHARGTPAAHAYHATSENQTILPAQNPFHLTNALPIQGASAGPAPRRLFMQTCIARDRRRRPLLPKEGIKLSLAIDLEPESPSLRTSRPPQTPIPQQAPHEHTHAPSACPTSVPDPSITRTGNEYHASTTRFRTRSIDYKTESHPF